MAVQTDNQDRVRHNTASHVNARIDRESLERIQRFMTANQPAHITQRIEELEREWDIERVLETNAAIFALIGLLLAVLHNTWWLVLPAVVLLFLLQHAIQGWCPPIEVFRRLGIRTRKEIAREKYALKFIRGDFAAACQDAVSEEQIWDAVWR